MEKSASVAIVLLSAAILISGVVTVEGKGTVRNRFHRSHSEYDEHFLCFRWSAVPHEEEHRAIRDH